LRALGACQRGKTISTQRVKLDAVDRRILEELRDDGRITNVELARRVGISAPPCLRRVRALEEAGFIRGYHADLNGAELGYTLTVFVWVGLHSQHESDLEAFEALARKWPMVRECHMLTGEADFILKVVARDWDRWQAFLTQQLTPAPNVASVKTAPVLRRSKLVFGVPLDAAGDGG
jgi:DNA-binding Lrp family transcriptional regulator